MLKCLLLYAGAFILAFAAALLLFSSPIHALASNDVPIVVAPTPTPDANTVLNSANDAASHAQDILNVVIAFTAILGLVLTLLTVFAAALTVLGVRSYREVVSGAQELLNNIAVLRAEGDKTRQALLYLTFGDRLLNQQNITEALAFYQKSGGFLPNDFPASIYPGAHL